MGVSPTDTGGHLRPNVLHSRHPVAPKGGHRVPWFTFVIHLRSHGDLEKWGATAKMRGPEGRAWRDRVLQGPPLHASTFSFRSNPAVGDLIVIPRLPEDVIYGDGPRLVARAVEIAYARGARVVGLGGLTAPATRGGASLLPSLPPDLTLTNGNALTAAAVRANVLDASEFLGCRRPRVAILGSTGSVGTAASQLLSEDDVDLLLIGRSTERARQAGPATANRIRYSGELADVAEADVILVLTSGTNAELKPGYFDGGRERVVIDVAQPPNIALEHREEFRRRRVRVVRGGWVKMSGAISSHAHEEVMTDGEPAAERGSAPACLAETYLFAMDGIREHAVGPGSPELARLLERIAKRRGVSVCSLPLETEEPDGLRGDVVRI
jgi:fatty aldehyde-generating acyl-ACP reductase